MKLYEIIQHIRHFEKTGEIRDALIPLFDQKGKWCGDHLNWVSHKLDHTHLKLRKVTLPKARRIAANRSGLILKTSFLFRGDDNISIDYTEVRGSVLVYGNPAIRAPSLHRVCGNLRTNTKDQIFLPELRKVGGNFEALRPSMLCATKLRHVGGKAVLAGSLPPMLESIGGDCRVFDALRVTENSLRSVGQSLVLLNSDQIYLPRLKKVGEDLSLESAKSIVARMLRSVGGSLWAGNADKITMPSLRSVGGDLDSQSAMHFYHPDLQVSGNWSMHSGALDDWSLRTKVAKALRGPHGPLYL